MKLADARENYYYHTGKLSDVSRQLSFAGIAVIWVFVVKDSNGVYNLDAKLLWPLGIFVVGLSLDLLHYMVSAASWGIFHRSKEKSGVGEEADFGAPSAINYAPNLLFWGKACATLAGYAALLFIFVS